MLDAIIRRAHAQLAAPAMQGVMRIIIAEGQRFPDLLDIYHRQAISKGRGLIEALVVRGIARGEFHPGAALAELPMVLFSPALTAALWQMMFGARDPIAADRFMEAHLNLVKSGLGVR